MVERGRDPATDQVLYAFTRLIGRHLVLWATDAQLRFTALRGAGLDALAAAERAQRGLYFAGQVRDGIALPACAASGLKAAQRVHEGA